MKKRLFCSIISFSLALILLFLAVSCGKRKIVINEVDLLAAYSPRSVEAGEVTDPFRAAMADFSFDLLRKMLNDPERGENKLLSPLSAVLCLALIANGADGETRRQMGEVLGMEPEQLNAALRAFTQGLSNGKDAKLELANSVWFRNSEALHVNESFLQTVADWYDAQIYASAFDQKTVKNINLWCEKHTDGMIPKIIESISPDEMIYLINALVFDAKWETEYQKDKISDGDFSNADGSKKTVAFLHSDESVFLSGEGFYGVAKNYKGGAYSFVGLLPTDETANIAAFASSLTGEIWRSAWDAREYRTVQTRIPEFKTEDFNKLTDLLRAMGMTDAFDAILADFGSMGTLDGGKLYLSDVFQKTYLELDRNGTKAAAVTWGFMKATSADPSTIKRVYLDRPFVYLIVDNATGLPLFVGVTEKL